MPNPGSDDHEHIYRSACCGGSPVGEIPNARCAKCGGGGPWVCECGHA